MKICICCGKGFCISEFSKLSSSKDGLQPYCRKCHVSKVSESRKKKPEIRIANRLLHMEKELAANRAYKAANKEKIRLQSKIDKSVRRMRELNAVGSFTKEDVKFLEMMQKGKCTVCKKELCGIYHVDHVIPLASGGANSKLNIQLLCASCNLSKASKDPIKFMQSRGYLI